MSEFFAMGGYAGYVWSSFALAAVMMIAEYLILRGRRKAVIHRLKRMAKAGRRSS